jgi:hypothetical protein
VKETGITENVPKGDIVCNRYEGEQGGAVRDIIWYNPDVWIVKKETYVSNLITGVNHIDTRIELIEVEFYFFAYILYSYSARLTTAIYFYRV